MKFQSLLFTMLVAVLSFAQVPTITNVSPLSGLPGSVVTITGTNFNATAGNNVVYFGSIQAPVIAQTTTSLTVIVPNDASDGKVSYTNLLSAKSCISKFQFSTKWNGGGTLTSGNFSQSFSEITASIVPVNVSSGYAWNDNVPFNTLASGDFNVDGKIDFVVATGNGTPSSLGATVYKNASTGSGNFTLGASTQLTTANEVQTVVVADFNMDSKLDIAVGSVGSSTNSISVFINTSTSGGANITFNSAYVITTSNNVKVLKVADINCDGKNDILYSTPTGDKINVALNNTTNINSVSFSAVSALITTGLIAFEVGDMNNDTKPDIIIGSTSSRPKLFLNGATAGSFSSTPTFTIATGATYGPYNQGDDYVGNSSIVDLDNDGYNDFTSGKNGSVIGFAQNTFTTTVNTFGAFNTTSCDGCGFRTIGAVDMDGDGRIDLMGGAMYTPPRFQVMLNTSTGSSLSFASYLQYWLSGSTTIANMVFDYDGNGKPDYITLTNPSTTTGSNLSIIQNKVGEILGISTHPSTTAQTYCQGIAATALTIVASGSSPTYQWEQSANGSTGWANVTSGTGATSTSYTPSTATAGTLYYRCKVTDASGSIWSNSSGAHTVNATNTAGTASSNPTLCINTALTAITRTTTGATGIGAATNLPAGVTASWSANTLTVSGTPTASGTFSYTIPLTGGCGSVNATGTITVNPLMTVGAASSSPNVCPNVAMTSVTHATTGATGIGTATGLPAGLSAAFASNTITISGTPTASGTFNYTIPLSGGCGTVNATGTIIVKGNNLAAVTQPSTTNQVYCLNATATALTTNFTDANVYQWYVMDAANWSGQQAISGATTNTYTPPTNVIGTKYYRCYVASCSGSNTSSAVSGAITVTDGSVWTGAVSTDPTNAGNWNSTCGSGNKIISASVANFPVYSDLTILAGETFTINEGARLTVNGILSNSGTLNINSGATVLQGSTSTYTGNGTVNVGQKITGGSTAGASVGRFWYLGAPVTGANATAFYSTSTTNIVKERDETTASWNTVANSSGVALTPGKGYYVRANNGTTSSGTTTELALNFTGGGLNNNPTSSAMTINCTRTANVSFDGFNLVSNPYPSYLNWDLVTKNNVGNTMWYRTSTGSFWNSTMVFETYVAGAAGGIGTNLSGNVATKLIPPMQAFWVRVNSGSTTGSITLDNSMRSHFASFGSSAAGLRSTNDELKLFLRMNLLQGESKDQLIVYVNGNATNGFDNLDGEKMMQSTLPQFYTKAGDKKIVINGLNSAKKQQSLPITMELPTTGVHTFEIENLEIESGLVWLEDTQVGTMEALTEGFTYQFYGEAGLNNDRFVLHFNILDNTTPSAPNYGEVNSSANFSGKGASVHAEAAGVVVIKLPAATEGVTDIQIRDAAGKLVYTGSTNTLETSVQLAQANGIYYVTLNSATGVEVRKVFIQQ